MITKFLDSLGGKLAERWLGTILTPAFIFWMGGFGVYVLRDWNLFAKDPFLKIVQDELLNIVKFLTKPENQPLQIPILIGSLLLVLSSGIIVNRCQFTVIRILEGYWLSLFKWIRRFCCWLQQRRKNKLNKKVQDLNKLLDENTRPLTSEESEELIKLDLILHYFPVNQVMPTQLR